MYMLIEYVTDWDKHGQRSTDITFWSSTGNIQVLSFDGRWMPEAEARERWPNHTVRDVAFARIGEAPEPA